MLSDDGHGTVTSTYTSETRYGNISPKRIYEYAKGTTRKPASEAAPAATPTAYSETRTYSLTKPSEPRTAPYGSRQQPPQKDFSASTVSPKPYTSEPIEKSRQYEEIDTSSFVTDSRSYGFPPKAKETYESVQIGGRPPLKYFGEEPSQKLQKKESPAKVDGGSYTTTYDRFREGQREGVSSDKVSREDLTSGRTGYTAYSAESYYSRSTFEPGKLRSNGRLAQDKDLSAQKRLSIDAPVVASYDRAKSDITADRYRGGPAEPATTVLGRSAEMEHLPKSWKSVELSEKDDLYRRGEDLPKQPFIGGDHRYVREGSREESRYTGGGEESRYRRDDSRDEENRIVEITSFSSRGKDKSYDLSEILPRTGYESKFQKKISYDHVPEAPLQTLSRYNILESS